MPRISPNITPCHTPDSLQTTLIAAYTHPKLEGKSELTLTYTPHKNVITPPDFESWLKATTQANFTTWEACLTALLDGAYDALLPRKIEISLTINHTNGLSQTLSASQRQPGH